MNGESQFYLGITTEYRRKNKSFSLSRISFREINIKKIQVILCSVENFRSRSLNWKNLKSTNVITKLQILSLYLSRVK